MNNIGIKSHLPDSGKRKSKILIKMQISNTCLINNKTKVHTTVILDSKITTVAKLRKHPTN